jgi:hypothetical protein
MIKFDYIKPVTYKKDFVKMDVPAKIRDLFKAMRLRVNEISDRSKYPSITEGTANLGENLKARGVAFKIYQDPEDMAKHMLEVSVLHPRQQIELTRPLVYGSKNNIMDFLNDDRSYNSALRQIREMCDEFRSV